MSFIATHLTSQFLSSPWFFRISSGFLRSFFPVIKLGSWVLVSRYDDVMEVLKRDKDFTISQINESRMKELSLNFFLGMDASTLHDREKGIMESITRHDDLPGIQKLLANECTRLLSTIQSEGKIEVVGSLSRLVPLALIEKYIGIPIEDISQMQGWMRALFNQLFLNLQGDKNVLEKAETAASGLKLYLDRIISEQEEKKGSLPDSLLSRLFGLQKEHVFIDNDFIRRNLSGLMIGAVDTTSKCVVLTLQELLNRPKEFKDAKFLAVQNDIHGLKRYCYEALRFNPHNPIVVRYAPTEARIGKNGRYTIPANCKVAAGIFSAMHDSAEFIHPGKFNPDRENKYLHFGYGMHECFGRHINAIQIPEIVASVLRLKNIRSSRINNGKIIYDGPFPQTYWLDFDK